MSPSRRSIRVVSLLLFVTFSLLYAAFDHLPRSPHSVSMGFTALNPEIKTSNSLIFPSSLTQWNSLSGSINWGNRFGLKDLGHQSANVKFRLLEIPSDIGFSKFGNSLYSESISYLAAGVALKEKFNLGASLAVYNLSIKNYGSAFSLGITGSWQISINEYLTWSGSLQNVNAPSIGKAKDPLPQIIYSEVSIYPAGNMMTVFGWEQDTEYSGRFKFGTEVKVFPWLSFSGGFISNPGQGTAGISIYVKNLGLYFGASTHPELGLSHWFGMGYSAN